ncbi:hypothetical protein IFR04_005605 [Cadophora malorum]|uniref:Uncharacterized protein n=1 Tax=Cadophora malorum TaxID=108018 RepID=A0A8H7WB52_9HELO|nr:hypothetical protein IFR04_005605 [Cadophora malorum]
MLTAKVLIPMSDCGHDPTETAVPYSAFMKAGSDVSFATGNGQTPECDAKMLKGITQKLLCDVQAHGCGQAGVRIPIRFHEGVQNKRFGIDQSDLLDTALYRNVAENEDHSICYL